MTKNIFSSRPSTDSTRHLIDFPLKDRNTVDRLLPIIKSKGQAMNCKSFTLIGILIYLSSLSTGELFIETIEKEYLERGDVYCVAMILSDNEEFESIPFNSFNIPYVISSLVSNENTNIRFASHNCKRHIFILRYKV